MDTKAIIEHKAKKLGVSIVIEESWEKEKLYTFNHDNKQYTCYSLKELEEELDNLLDGGFYRRAEAEDYARYEDRAFGDQNEA